MNTTLDCLYYIDDNNDEIMKLTPNFIKIIEEEIAGTGFQCHFNSNAPSPRVFQSLNNIRKENINKLISNNENGYVTINQTSDYGVYLCFYENNLWFIFVKTLSGAYKTSREEVESLLKGNRLIPKKRSLSNEDTITFGSPEFLEIMNRCSSGQFVNPPLN